MIAILTISDTRTVEDDRSGATIRDMAEAAGHRIATYEIVRDEVEAIRRAARRALGKAEIFALICTGGTGFAVRDVTPEALGPLIDRDIPGFGEMFRVLSHDDIGSSTVQSRAFAGVADGRLVFGLPGSTGACRLAMEALILPQLDPEHRPCNFREILVPR
ncbi:MAG: molybdenum cofactor biosynthesis protein [Candidatus Dadabacteria bacterium]|nr:MAG: molybdenum cofactor biosynthesis protein [Candidatus Dadabacteria bacterium]